MNREAAALIDAQRAGWPLARDNYASLSGVRTRTLDVHGVSYRLQFNPGRVVSSSARVDAASVAERRCFLCAAHRPPEQRAMAFGERYEILVNPFPIFERHLTIVDVAHVDQRIEGRFGDLLALGDALSDYVVFYNGPQCGASAPDHAHFQAGSRGLLPLEAGWRTLAGAAVARCGDAVLWRVDAAGRRAWVIESTGNDHDMARLFDAVHRALPRPDGAPEPLMNLLAWRDGATRQVAILPRARHRPSCFPAVLCSPASVDLGGVFVLPRQQDFEALDAAALAQVLDEVCLAPALYEAACDRIAQALHTASPETP